MDADNGNAAIDIAEPGDFVRYFLSLPSCPENTIRLFNRNDYYTAHGEEAIFLAQSFMNTMTAIKMIGTDENKIESILISSTRFEPLLHHLLIDHNMCLQIYNRQDDDWILTTEASLTNLGEFEELVHGFNTPILNQIVLGLTMQASIFYFVCFDLLKCDVIIGSFRDDDKFAHLETLLVQLNPRECFIDEHAFNKVRLESILSRNKVIIKAYKSADEDVTRTETLLEILLKPEAKEKKRKIYDKYKLAFTPFCDMMKYLKLDKDAFCRSSYSLTELIIDSYVHLDLSSLSNLHLFPAPEEIRSKGVRSLYQLLDHCQTASGKALLDSFIRKPETNLETIEQRQNVVEYFIKNWALVASPISDSIFDKIPDTTKIYKKFIAGRSSLKEIYQIYLSIEQLPLLIKIFGDLDHNNPLEQSIQRAIHSRLVSLSKRLLELKTLIFDSIDFERFNQTTELWVRATFNEELQELKNSIEKIDVQAAKHFDVVCQSLEKDCDIPTGNIRLECEKNRYYFRVSKANITNILKDNDYTEVSSNSKDGKFVDAKLEEINSRYFVKASNYDQLQQSYIQELIEKTRRYLDSFAEFESIVAYIDTTIALAKAARSATTQYVRPKMLPKGSGKIVLHQFRHPIIEVLKQSNYARNDVSFDEKKQKFHVLTGINMGGKSSFIRSVALNVLMAQIGSFVPADGAEISVVDAIFSRLNASDDPNSGLSTFYSEMVEAAAILDSATANSLVIIDELGRSTDSSDGFGLASAIVDHLVNKLNVFGLFATHFHKLSEYNDRVGKLCMKSEFIDGDIVSYFQAEAGTSHNSFGIEIMRALEFPQVLIENAQTRLKSNGAGAEQLINNFIGKLKKMTNNGGAITKEMIIKQLHNLRDVTDTDSGGHDYVKAFMCKAMEDTSME